MKHLLAIFSTFLLLTTSHATEPVSFVTLENFKLVGDLNARHASFTLTATARVQNSKGAELELLSGPIALTRAPSQNKWHLKAEQNRYLLVFDRSGKYPIELQFAAIVVRQNDAWHTVDFHVAPGTLQALTLRGLSPETQFEFPDAARPERVGNEFKSILPGSGAVKLSWKEARPETEGKLFFAAEMLSQVTVSPGVMRQVALLDLKVMQGELNRLALLLTGPGEITRVQGDHVLAWNLEPVPGSSDRRLVVQFNQPQKDQFNLQIQLQTPLGAFPQAADVMQLRPENATRFAGHFRIVNDGAVRLEVARASGLSQISPDQFPESDATRTALQPPGNQRFAYRFSNADFALRIQADQILPELSVSQLTAYRLAENELDIDAEIELDIREAPLRELLLRIPKGYGLAHITSAGMSDYFLREPDQQSETELRLVYGQPVSGRQLIQLRLERNKPLGESAWPLPRVEVIRAKSVHGYIAVAADPGFRLTPERTQGLTEIATAFFPRKITGIQAAFRLSDSAWQAALRVERLPQSIQADVFHLFSIGEGIAYGSSVINYVVSGAPVSLFKVELSDEYFNVEFTGKDLRNWQKTEGGYLVQLHTPVAGVYTLLASYERPFKSQGETLTFTGARPLDAQSEQGHVLIISAYQFQVKPADVSLLPLETAEVPPEYRLFFDAPILAAYRYVSRPFNLKLALSPLAQGDSLSQVVDRASLNTRISKEGQVLTDLRYFLKNRGHPHLRLRLPAETQLWSANVNGAPVVPVTDNQDNLIPLPQGGDPNAVLTLDLKLASRSSNPSRVTVVTPSVGAPVMLAEWKLQPDPGQRLLYRKGSLTPLPGLSDNSGFAQLVQVFTNGPAGQSWALLLAALGLAVAAWVLWRWASQPGVWRNSSRHVLGTLAGIIAFVFATIVFFQLAQSVDHQKISVSREVLFLAPIQQAGNSLNVELSNVTDRLAASTALGFAWPALLAFVVWSYGWFALSPAPRMVSTILGWSLLTWAALRVPNGALLFLLLVALFILVQVFIPELRRLTRLPVQPQSPPEPASGATSAATAMVLLGFLSLATFSGRSAELRDPREPSQRISTHINASGAGKSKNFRCSEPTPLADSLTQEIRIEDKFAFATAKIHWRAEKGQTLPVLLEPAVLTRLVYPTNQLKLIQSPIIQDDSSPLSSTNVLSAHQLLALRSGSFDIEMHYQLQVARKETETGLTLPVPYALINRLQLTVANFDVDVRSPEAVSVERDFAGGNTVAKLVLTPVSDPWVGWRPRSRDVKSEKPVFYAEIAQLYAPAAGVVEAVHQVSVRPAQGELNELVFTVPPGVTITDVLDPAKAGSAAEAKGKAASSLVNLWRFDPDTRKLRVTLTPPQSRPFALLVRSQIATGPLPSEQSIRMLTLDSASNQIGLLGVATGNEVQLDSVSPQALSPMNLEDFPRELVSVLQPQIPTLTVRHAFRYTDTKAALTVKASAVEPDVRVETQDTVSLGEDRVVLAANTSVEITRAGIFQVSFVMPSGFDVESISGGALSHWTEQKNDAGRVITLHLNGRTEGQQQFAISLAGPGLKATNSWAVPQLNFREANRQRGSLLLVPEQGLRLQVAASEGFTQLDPQKSGIKQKGVLAFRVLQASRMLALKIEQVNPWIQVTSLQHAAITEAQVKVTANLQYQIDNTGLKLLRVLLPANAEGVRFQGDQLADFHRLAGAATNGLISWEIKLHRRVIGAYLLQVAYETPVPERFADVALRGVQVADINLQRGYVTVQTTGRLQVRSDNPPPALQPAEWQSIPRALQQGLSSQAANFTYRLVEPDFELPLKLERHEAAKLLAARVNAVDFTSVVSDQGVMLTQARLEILPGDKRLLNLTLPANAHFWFAFVNQNGVWPWSEQGRILIPLEQPSCGEKVIHVEVFYSSQIGSPDPHSLNLQLLAPKFDLPLENITWRVSLGDKWHLKKWSGSLQFQQEENLPQTAAADAYLQNETTRQQERTREAEGLLAAGNSALQQGDPQQARRAFQAAYGLSSHDAAFNEDARVQLHNIKLQQALIGLNVRQATSAGERADLGGKVRDLRNRKELNYTQQDAKDILDRNTADDNAAFMKLAERLIQQQDAAVTAPTALRASVPAQGRMFTFKRSVLVDPWADLKIDLKASAARAGSSVVQVVVVLAVGLLFVVLALAARPMRSA